jgi:hypothetical protein
MVSVAFSGIGGEHSESEEDKLGLSSYLGKNILCGHIPQILIHTANTLCAQDIIRLELSRMIQVIQSRFSIV